MTLDVFYKLKSQELDAQIEAVRGAITHNLSKGLEGEKLLIDFLKASLPKKYNCSRGFLIDSKGNTSSEIDIMVWNEQFVPSMAFRSFHLLPIEIVCGCVEVKLKVNQQKLQETFKKFSYIRNNMTLKDVKEAALQDNALVWKSTSFPEMFLFCWEFDLGKEDATIKNNLREVFQQNSNISSVKICSLKDGNIATIVQDNSDKLVWVIPETTENLSGQILSFFLHQLFIPSLNKQISPSSIMRHYLPGCSNFVSLE